jgi:hypothetical protein
MKNMFFIALAVALSACGSGSEPVEPIPPPVPLATAATSVTGEGFTANWNTVDGAEGYELEVATDADFSAITIMETTEFNSVNIRGLDPVTEYYYRVRANFSSQILSANSNVISLFTLPDPPAATAATNETSDGFTANWQEVAGISSYLLFLSEDSFASVPAVYVSGYAGKEVSGTSHEVTGLDPGVLYYYALKSKHGGALSVYSNSIIAVTTN